MKMKGKEGNAMAGLEWEVEQIMLIATNTGDVIGDRREQGWNCDRKW